MSSPSTAATDRSLSTKIPLNLAGAYAAAPPPKEFDFTKATADELTRRGFSVAAGIPSVLAELQRLHSKGQLQWITPELATQKGKVHIRGRHPETAAGELPQTTNWSGGVLYAAGAAPIVTANRQIDGYATEFNQQQHINFVGGSGHVYELVFMGGGWTLNDLTQQTGGVIAQLTSAIAGYPTNYNRQQHVNFIGSDNHVHELFYNGGSWQQNDLTNAGHAPNPVANSPLAGYATEFNQQQHVIFIGPNNHIFELLYDNGWTSSDLTAVSGAQSFPARGNSPLDAYVTTGNSQQHINYVGADNNVHELVYDGSWKHNNLTQQTGAGPVAAGSAITGYATDFNSQQHVNYIGVDSHVHELVYDGSWKHNDLTQQTGSPDARIGPALHGYATAFNRQQHVNFSGLDNAIHELVYDNGWRQNNLFTSTGPAATFPDAATTLSGYATFFNNQQHVIYVGVNGHVEELYYDSQWKFNDLSGNSVTGKVADSWMLAQGMWNVPQVSQPDLPDGAGGGWDSSSWVGIDGSQSNDVLQAGIEQKFDGGNASYTAWYEWYAPARDGSPDYIDQTNIENFPVAAGHNIWCVARYTNNLSKGAVLLVNRSTGHSFTIELDPPPGAAFEGNCIEWIMETPTIDGSYTALPAFGEVLFTSANGVKADGTSGEASTATIATIFKNDVALTKTTLSSNQVAIDYLPWHALDLHIEAGATVKVAAATRIDGYATEFNQQLHANFLGTDSHVYELVFDGAWKVNDLSGITGAPAASLANPVAGYATEFNRQQHVIYIGTDRHIHELYYDGSWKKNDLSSLSGANILPAVSSPLDAYVTSFNQQQHINYIGVDNHVHEIVYDGSWKTNDLTTLAPGAALPGTGSGMTGYATEFNRQQHVLYVGADSHVHELVYDGAWKHNDLTQGAGAPNAQLPVLHGYATGFNQQQHVNFLGADSNVYELVYDGAWKHNDLTSLGQAPNASASVQTSLSGYATEFNQQQHVNFFSVDGHVHELWYGARWQHNDLTAASGSGNPRAPVTLAGFASNFNQQQHVLFVSVAGSVIELMY